MIIAPAFFHVHADRRRPLACSPTSRFRCTCCWWGRRSCCWRWPPARPLPLYRVALGGVRLGLWLSGIKVVVVHGREHPARPRRGLRGQSRQQRRAADSVRGAERALPAAADPLQGRAAQAADPGPRVRSRRVRAARAGQPRSEPAGDRAGGGGPARGELVPDLSGGHAQPDRRAVALQEGRVHHGVAGAARRSCRWRSRARATR